MTTLERTVARGAGLAGAVAVTAGLLAGLSSGMLPSTAAGSRSDPAPCVATVLPDTYYQAIAELNACTGMDVAVEIEPAGTYWAIRGDVPPPGADGIRVSP